MSRFDFRADTATEEDLRRWRKQSRPSYLLTGMLTGGGGWILVGLASLYVYHAYLNYHSRFGRRVALIEGRMVIASNVILLVDTSGSMRGTDTILNQQLDQLQKAGIAVGNRANTEGFGFGVATQGAANNALHNLKAALQLNPTADAIYLFSDFDPGGNDSTDEDGYAQLHELILQGHRRLYLGIVRVGMVPEPELVRIVKQSDGDLIESK